MKRVIASDAASRRIADVCIGDVYEVWVSGELHLVELIERADSGIWLGRNQETRSPLYVGFADLGNKMPTPTPQPIDKRSLAAGEKGDE